MANNRQIARGRPILQDLAEMVFTRRFMPKTSKGRKPGRFVEFGGVTADAAWCLRGFVLPQDTRQRRRRTRNVPLNNGMLPRLLVCCLVFLHIFLFCGFRLD
jgi:hypothetical protein